MSCSDCLRVKCRLHAVSTEERSRGVTLSSARGWLRKWERAEERLKLARREERSARKNSNKHFERFYAAVNERHCAEADVEKKKDSFASCMRWLMERRQL